MPADPGVSKLVIYALVVSLLACIGCIALIELQTGTVPGTLCSLAGMIVSGLVFYVTRNGVH